jgi:hypothetical protein
MSELGIALQEWAALCQALGDGRLLLTVRKGGIHERGGGLFHPEHERFALLPSHLHQDSTRVQPAYVSDVNASKVAPADGMLHLGLWAEVACVWKVTDLLALQGLGPELLWTPHDLATRFAYRDEPWLYVLALRVMRLPSPAVIPDDPAYAGCRSWIPLKQPLDTTGSLPVLSSGYFETRLDRIATVLSPGRTVSRAMSGPRSHRTPRT